MHFVRFVFVNRPTCWEFSCDDVVMYIATMHAVCFLLAKKFGAFTVRTWPTDHRLSDLMTRNLSGDEIANVNFLYDDIVHVLQNTIDSCINSATDRRRYVLERMFTKFSEITQYNGHYVVQGHSRSPILVPVESSYTTSY